jgi:hypothetical protein
VADKAVSYQCPLKFNVNTHLSLYAVRRIDDSKIAARRWSIPSALKFSAPSAT